MKHYSLLLAFFFAGYAIGQSPVTPLDATGFLLNERAKRELSAEIKDRDMVFLGESEHHIGSDLQAKCEFVKFLVLEHGYRHIAFEADFFALHLTHDKDYLWPFWSRSTQCRELFEFLKQHQVTIWGFDSQFSSAYSFRNFSPKLFAQLERGEIPYEPKFRELVETVCSQGSDLDKKLSKKEIAYLLETIDALTRTTSIIKDALWLQLLNSFKSMVLQYTSAKSRGYEIRDKQMASNLHFVCEALKNQKVIVWAANAHISKMDEKFMDGKIMGSEFLKLTDRKTYHIAFSPIKMPYRNTKFIQSQAADPDNLLSLLPDASGNSMIFSSTLEPEMASRKFTGMFGMGKTALAYFGHFDALVFIGQGEKVAY